MSCNSVKTKLYSIVILLLIAGCKTTTKMTSGEIEEFPYGRYVVSYGDCGGSDSLEFKKVGDNLYRDNKNKLYFLCYDESDETGKRKTPVFILRFSNDCDNDLTDSIYDIGKVIDVASFKKSEDGFYRDKYNKYEFISFADGGHLSVIENDSSTYKEIGKGFYKGADGNTYIKTRSMSAPPLDENWGNYHFRKVPDIDVATYDDYGQIDGYAKDKNHVYFRRGTTDGDFIDLVEVADPNSFQFDKTDRSVGWDNKNLFINGILEKGMNRDSLIKSGGK